MIRYNYATELCMTWGQEGIVCGWQSKTSFRGQRILNTLFVELKNPPTDVQFMDCQKMLSQCMQQPIIFL